MTPDPKTPAQRLARAMRLRWAVTCAKPSNIGAVSVRFGPRVDSMAEAAREEASAEDACRAAGIDPETIL